MRRLIVCLLAVVAIAVVGCGPTTRAGAPAGDWAESSAGGGQFSLSTSTDSLGWGANYTGQLGDGTTIIRRTPTRVGSESDWATVSAGTEHSLAIKTDGSLWAWGRNDDGRLGDATTIERDSPVRIGSDFDWVAASAGGTRSVALKAEAPCGPGDTMPTAAREPALQARGFRPRLGCGRGGRSFLVALKEDGSLWAWGRNHSGQFGRRRE